jgi:hypothetical protein
MRQELRRIEEKYMPLFSHPGWEADLKRLIDHTEAVMRLMESGAPAPVKAVSLALLCQAITAFCDHYEGRVGSQVHELKMDLLKALTRVWEEVEKGGDKD